MRPEIKVIAKSWGDSITLRWAPTTPSAWKQLNYYGYSISRVTIKKRGHSLYHHEQQSKKLAEVKVASESQFAEHINDNDYIGIAAQAIFGESFELQQYGTGPVGIYNQALELENRYSFTLFSADQDVLTAGFAGLSYTDKYPEKDETYLYIVSSLIPQTQYPIDSGFVLISSKDIIELSAPTGLKATFGDHSVQLQWQKPLIKNPFTGYIIERSVDGKNFRAVNKQAFIGAENKEKSNYYYYLDSLESNGLSYHYRVRGRSAFGELSPPSNVEKGKASPQTQGQIPQLQNTQVIDNQKIQLRWTYPQELEKAIEGFVVYRSKGIQNQYEAITKTLSSKTREWTDKKPQSNNFYQVGVIDKQGKIAKSITVLGQLQDSIPPQAPQGVQAKIDTSGKVSIQWNSVKAKDLQGYQVFRSYNPNTQFVLISQSIQNDTLYQDNVAQHTLNTHLYYQVIALDWNGNKSDFSEMYALPIPDLNPPTSPIFKNIHANKEGVNIQWIHSSSQDVSYESLYRRVHIDSAWVELIRFQKEENWKDTYFDKGTGKAFTAHYQVRATDFNGLESQSQKYLTGQHLAQPKEEQNIRIQEIRPEVQGGFVFIRWKQPKQALQKYELYRATNDGPLRLLKILDKETLAIEDRIVERNTKYSYRIRAVYADGSKSNFSKLTTVNY